MLGDAGLHQASVQALRPLLMSAQSENTGGFVTVCDGPPGMAVTGLPILSAFMQFHILYWAV